MWLEILMLPFLGILILFIIFWIVQEGSHWQKRKFLGPFAKFIQASPLRAFLIFLVITILMVPSMLLLLLGLSWDIMNESIRGQLADTVPIVNTLLLTFLMFAMMIPVLWSSFRTWRHSVRQIAEVRVRTTS